MPSGVYVHAFPLKTAVSMDVACVSKLHSIFKLTWKGIESIFSPHSIARHLCKNLSRLEPADRAKKAHLTMTFRQGTVCERRASHHT